MPKPTSRRAEELPPDNTARIVLFDAMAEATHSDPNFDGLEADALFNLGIPRLRVLVPRELHVQGEEPYVKAKIAVCVDAGILQDHPRRIGRFLLGPKSPRVRYPDGTFRDYPAGLEAARERLEAYENRLRRAAFNVRDIITSPASTKKSDRYRRLKASMEEHGFLDQFPIIDGSGGVVDGKARLAAAAELNITLRERHRVQLPRRRDTPLHQALLVLDVNADRLDEEDAAKVHDLIAERTGRSWFEIEADLELTREWRRAEPKDYTARLDVKLVPFGDRPPKAQVTVDGTRFMLRSAMREAGMPEYRRDDLLPYVASEEAGTQLSGKKAIFVRIDDAIVGIRRMQRDRASNPRLKFDPAWDEIREWLEGLQAEQLQDAPAVERPNDA